MTVNADRSRGLYAVIAAATIALGLTTRRFPDVFPGWFAQYAGDALWAAMVFWIIALVWRRRPTIHIAAAAIVVAFAVEVSQLYRAEWIDAIRTTRIGALILGSGFLWSDLLCYVIGVGLAAALDVVLRTRASSFP